MKRLQIPKFVPRWMAERVRALPPIEDDPFWGLVGIAGPDVGPEPVDDVLYGG